MWFSSAAWASLRQSSWLASGDAFKAKSKYTLRDNPVVPAWALEELRLTPATGRIHCAVACPSCSRAVRQLAPVEWDTRWACRTCHPQWIRESPFWLQAMEYACAVRMAVGGWPLRGRYIRLSLRVIQEAPKAHSTGDLRTLAMASGLLRIPLWDSAKAGWWWRRPPRMWRGVTSKPPASGPVAEALRKHLVSAMLDSVIHPVAFYERYVRG